MKLLATAPRPSPRAGLSLLEVTMAMAITALIVLSSAAAFLGSLAAVQDAQRTNQAGAFASTVLEDLAAQPFDTLLTFNGNAIYDEPEVEDAHFEVRLTVFAAAVNLIQINALLTDLDTNRELGRFTTLRTLQ